MEIFPLEGVLRTELGKGKKGTHGVENMKISTQGDPMV